MQSKRPRFNPLILALALAAVLMVWSVLGGTGSASSSSMEYSTVVHYFESLQVTQFSLDLNTGVITMDIKEGGKNNLPLPDTTAPSTTQATGGLLSGMLSSSDSTASAAQKNSDGTVTVRYKLPYASMFVKYVGDYIAAYDEANPDAPMVYDYTPVKESIPWMEILFYLAMLGCTGFLLFSMMRGGAGGGGIMNVGKAKVKDEHENKKTATFADVAGEDEEKEELKEVVEFLKSPEKFNTLGARIPHGVLLVGPPGTGKTLLARACAGEAGVPFYSISGSDFVEMYVGVGASRVRDLFDKAKKSMPCIIFIDEIDAVGRQRGAGLGGGHDEREQTLNQLLVEMDGFAPNLGVIVMAATNRKDILDPALLRPGRFDRHITVNYPDVKGREAILRVHTRNKPIGPDVDLAVIARFTGGFTGADLENLTNEAALLAARKNRKAITMEDIQEATLKVAVGPEKRSHVITDKERRLTAYHESGHAIVTYYCPQQDKVHQVSIVPRGWAGGFTLALPEKDVSYQTKKWMEEEIAVLLAGRVAEQLVLEDVSTGASNDIERATKIARAMVCRYGFSEKLGPMIYGSDQEEVFLGRDLGHARDYSEEVAGQIDEEARRFIDEGYNKAVSLLEEHMDQLHALAEFLMKYEKIDGDLFAEVMSGVISFGEAAERTEQELASAREKAERARLQKEAQQKAAEEKKAQQGFSVDPLDFHLPHEEPPAQPMEEPKEDEDKQDPSGPADL